MQIGSKIYIRLLPYHMLIVDINLHPPYIIFQVYRLRLFPMEIQVGVSDNNPILQEGKLC